MADRPKCATYPNELCACRGALQPHVSTCTRRREHERELQRRAELGEGTEVPVCVHCGGRIYFGIVIVGEWTHWHGDSFCHDAAGYCATPLHRATPAYHPAGAVL